MGQSKGGGYQKLPTVQPGQQSLLDFMNSFAPGALSQAQSGYAQFLPGGGGGEALKQQALESYKQQYIPAALNAFGADVNAKGGGALNQALAQGAANLNTNVAAQLAQNQLSAAEGLGSLGSGAGQLGLGTSTFNYVPQPIPFWKQLLLGSLGQAGSIGSGIGSVATGISTLGGSGGVQPQAIPSSIYATPNPFAGKGTFGLPGSDFFPGQYGSRRIGSLGLF